MLNIFTLPWPWYISGPLIGLMVPLLLILGNKPFGISSSLRHICAACFNSKIPFFEYNWKKEAWVLWFSGGIIIGGFIIGGIFHEPSTLNISASTVKTLNSNGISVTEGYAPYEIFSFPALFSLRGFICIVIGGFLVGFGTRYAGGCTSGHSIMGLSNLQWPSLLATCCFFAGGLLMSWFILPYILQL